MTTYEFQIDVLVEAESDEEAFRALVDAMHPASPALAELAPFGFVNPRYELVAEHEEEAAWQR